MSQFHKERYKAGINRIPALHLYGTYDIKNEESAASTTG